jgi:NAD(P) transhydrogenase
MPEDEPRQLKVDLVVIGSGPAGQKAAIQAAKFGKKVVVVEARSDPGGVCLNTGTIPSKSLREAILDLTDYYERSFYGRKESPREVTISDLNFRLNKVLTEERTMIRRQFKKNGIELIHGWGHFVDSHTVHVTNEARQLKWVLNSDYFLIAVGSRPRNPETVPFDEDVILDSAQLLNLHRVPKSMIVLGGGVIGSEYASFFAALGTKVTVIDKRDHMLPLLDAEIGIHLQTALSDIGLQFRGNCRPEKIERINDRAHVTFKDGSTAEAEILLYALGTEANVGPLQLHNVGVHVNERGYITVNQLFQTSQSHIYAVGDVIGGPCLASTSMEQGRLAARHAFGAKIHHFPTFFPLGIYTIPEISTCGYTEEELNAFGFRYEVGRAYYYEIARSHITGSNTGMFKILFHAETGEILGVHVIGRGATEVIHIGQVAMSFNAHIDYFIDQVFNYPTYAEGYRVAALNGCNKIKHKR